MLQASKGTDNPKYNIAVGYFGPVVTMLQASKGTDNSKYNTEYTGRADVGYFGPVVTMLQASKRTDLFIVTGLNPFRPTFHFKSCRFNVIV